MEKLGMCKAIYKIVILNKACFKQGQPRQAGRQVDFAAQAHSSLNTGKAWFW